MIEKAFDVPFVARLALREKQIQQTYRPVIGVHKWFARRPGSIYRALLLSEFAPDEPLPAAYYKSHDLRSLVVGDPFMGGGTPVLEANRVGCAVVGADINPMAFWIVHQELDALDLPAFQAEAEAVIRDVDAAVGALYTTTCARCRRPDAPVKYFLWVKEQACAHCGERQPLFGTYLLAKNERHPNYVVVCPACGTLNESERLDAVPATPCRCCGERLRLDGPARKNGFACRACGQPNRYPHAKAGAPAHHLYAIEYQCPDCTGTHRGRAFKAPDAANLARVAEAEVRLGGVDPALIPDDPIPPGDETARLHRWGYRAYRDLFNPRQLVGLSTLARRIMEVAEPSLRHALLTVFSDALRYQNLLCRYDAYALKVLDVFSVHGFPVGLAPCESALLGIPGVGSGGFRHFVEKYVRAKAFCERPYEFTAGTPKRKVPTPGERIGARFVDAPPESGACRVAYLRAAPADTLSLLPGSLDAVLTDPPYFANVQYAELMDFCYVWLRRYLKGEVPGFEARSTRASGELTVNQTEGRDIEHYTEGMSRVFTTFARALKPGGPFAFTFHHNRLEAYLPIAVALLDAGLVCTASLACPAEMGASIHINGTGSSVLDTVFVCRTHGRVAAAAFEPGQDSLKRLLAEDAALLTRASVTPTRGDLRCLLYGHLTRLVVWEARAGWDAEASVESKIGRVREAFERALPTSRFEPVALGALAAYAALGPLPLFATLDPAEAYDAEPELSF